MNYRLHLNGEDNVVLSIDDEESWKQHIVMSNINHFEFNQNFIIVSNDKVTKFLRFENITIDKSVGIVLEQKKGLDNESNFIK